MVVLLGGECQECKNFHKELLDGWDIACNAFPEGIPTKYINDVAGSELPECANGFRFEDKRKI